MRRYSLPPKKVLEKFSTSSMSATIIQVGEIILIHYAKIETSNEDITWVPNPVRLKFQNTIKTRNEKINSKYLKAHPDVL